MSNTNDPAAALSPREKLSAGRLMAVTKLPYFRAAIMGMIPRETEIYGADGQRNPTFAVTDRGVFLWDPEAVKEWTVPEIAAVIVHEVQHLIRNHAKRCKSLGAIPMAFNIAGDLEINDDIAASDMKLPDGACYPKTFGFPDGQLAETYYDKLRQNAKPCGHAKGQACEADGKGSGKGKGDKGKDGEKGSGCGGQSDDAPNATGGWCGSAAGRPIPGEPSEKEEPGRTEVDVERLRQETARSIQDHASRSRGTVPGSLLRWAEETLKPPQIPWRQKLARACRNAFAQLAGSQDYSYARPSRRQAAVGYGDGRPIFPVMRAPRPNVVVAIDTSGSMSDRELSLGLSETAGVLTAVGTSVRFMSCDAMVHANAPVRHWKDALKLLKGGGGTDFRPVFEAVDAMADRPDVLVFITDGCGPAPSGPPKGIHVIWLLVGRGHMPPCTWGEQIALEENE